MKVYSEGLTFQLESQVIKFIYTYIFPLNFQCYEEIIKLSKTLELESYWGKEDNCFIVQVMWPGRASLRRSHLSLDQNELRVQSILSQEKNKCKCCELKMSLVVLRNKKRPVWMEQRWDEMKGEMRWVRRELVTQVSCTP